MIGCLANKKGGAAKSTNTVHIGACLAEKGYKTLIIDFDEQCDISHGVGIKKADYDIIDFLENRSSLRLKSKSDNFYILPGSSDLISLFYPLNSLKKAIYKKRDNGISLADYMDFIFIDVPPSKIIPESMRKYKVYTEMEIALFACDFFMIPLTAEEFAVKNCNRFLKNAFDFISEHDLSIEFLGFFFGKILLTSNSYAHYSDLFHRSNSEMLFKTFVRQDSQIQKASQIGKTIFQFSPGSRAASDYRKLTNEFLKILNHHG
jgi:chromosome partitioning protein